MIHHDPQRRRSTMIHGEDEKLGVGSDGEREGMREKREAWSGGLRWPWQWLAVGPVTVSPAMVVWWWCSCPPWFWVWRGENKQERRRQEREGNERMRKEEREESDNIIIIYNYTCCYSTILQIRWYCSSIVKFFTIDTFCKSGWSNIWRLKCKNISTYAILHLGCGCSYGTYILAKFCI